MMGKPAWRKRRDIKIKKTREKDRERERKGERGGEV